MKASVTRLQDCVQILELKHEVSNADKLMTQHLLKKLEKQDVEFKKYCYIIVELLENEEDLEQEQVL